MYSALVSALELLLEVSYCFMANESMRVPLNIWTDDIIERLLAIYLA